MSTATSRETAAERDERIAATWAQAAADRVEQVEAILARRREARARRADWQERAAHEAADAPW